MNKNTLLQGDCLELMKDMPAGSIDLTVTSPPYDNLRTYNGNVEQWSFEKFKAIAQEIYRVTADGGVVVWVVGDATIKGSETGTSFQQALWFMECGFSLHDTMIWYKGSCLFPDKTRYYQAFEYMFVFSKGKPKAVNLIEDRENKWKGTKAHGTERRKDGSIIPLSAVKLKNNRVVKDFGVRYNVWSISPERKNKTGHPAVFPLQIAKDHIMSWSVEGDVVLDPFMGSGTTGIACMNTNRRFVGMELDEGYFNIAKERIEATQHEKIKLMFT